jgi:glycosyltransferase involved in cell wall biosynthesis
MSSSQSSALLSIVFVVHNEAERINSIIADAKRTISQVFSDYEIVIIDNGSTDETPNILRDLTSQGGEANLQVFILAGHVDDLTGRWVGVENSLGDVVICFDPHHGDIEYLELLVREAANDNDIVFTTRTYPRGRRSLPSIALYKAFGVVTKLSTGLDLGSYSTSLIAISRRVINFLLQFPNPQIKFRNLPSTTGFKRATIAIPPIRAKERDIKIRESLSRGIQLVTSSSDNPLRLATTLSGLGAFLSLLYSVYVLCIWAIKDDVASGWVSLSIQQSVMFFLISLVLVLLSEYVLDISRKANSGPSYYIADEFTSAKLTKKERLNVEIERGRKVPRPTRNLFNPLVDTSYDC